MQWSSTTLHVSPRQRGYLDAHHDTMSGVVATETMFSLSKQKIGFGGHATACLATSAPMSVFRSAVSTGSLHSPDQIQYTVPTCTLPGYLAVVDPPKERSNKRSCGFGTYDARIANHPCRIALPGSWQCEPLLTATPSLFVFLGGPSCAKCARALDIVPFLEGPEWLSRPANTAAGAGVGEPCRRPSVA